MDTDVFETDDQARRENMISYRIRIHCQNDHVMYLKCNGTEEQAEELARILDGRQVSAAKKPGICHECRAPFVARVEEIFCERRTSIHGS